MSREFSSDGSPVTTLENSDPLAPLTAGRAYRSQPQPSKPLAAIVQAVPFAAEVAAAAAGSLLLWWGADGHGVVRANRLAITLFIASLTVLFAGRVLVLGVLRAERSGILPASTRRLAILRNIVLVIVAVYSSGIDSYFVQWIITFAALAVLTAGTAGLVLGLIDKSGTAPIRFLDAAAGAIAVVFTSYVHGWDPQFIAPLCALVIIPAFFAHCITEALDRS